MKNSVLFGKTNKTLYHIKGLPKAQKINVCFARLHRIEIKQTNYNYFKISKSQKYREQKITHKQHETTIYFT